MTPPNSDVSASVTAVLRRVVCERHRVGQRPGVLGIAEREVPVLDGEDVREVVPDLEGELELDAPVRVVLDDYVVLHPVADEPLARDRELVLAEAAHDRVAQEERGREVVHASEESSSGRAPFTVSTQRERKRVSLAKSPAVASSGRRARRRRRTSTPRES